MSGELHIELATSRDVPPLAVLHRACLPDSMISMLGPAAVARYYDLVTTSASEHVFVARARGMNRQDTEDAKPRGGGEDDVAVAAGCVLTLEPHTVLRRFARAAPLRLAADLARQTIGAAFRRRLLARVRDGSAVAVPSVPEVTQIFTDASLRGKGHGRALLRACEDKLRDLGQLTYCIHTLRDDNDAGIRFYRREGFTQTGTSRSFGDDYLVMTKGLS
ncbi:MAG: GNAT family N-acetyltransferase [Deltaproteobacteria bacterium]|nr:GNAT family N-acetyltransferase [Deltaproteobacteria bacterium]